LRPGHSATEIEQFLARGYWGTTTLAERVSEWAGSKPAGLAFAGDTVRLTWRRYDEVSNRVADALIAAGLQPGDRVATLLPDGPEAHVAWLGAEKAGVVAVGIGSRAGYREVRHLIEQSGASAVLTTEEAGRDGIDAMVSASRSAGRSLTHIVMAPMGPGGEWSVQGADPALDGVPATGTPDASARLGASDLFFLNSTSGTTGLPKCVMHTQNRWAYFHHLAVEAGDLTGEDVFCSAVASPFGFGLWTGHFTPTYLGAPCHLRRRFSPEGLIELVAEEKVTVLAAVTTQLIMLLNCSSLRPGDLSSLRVVFTGGEAVPYARAAEFEDRTGAQVLQFYGSNETGALSRTTTRDGRRRRLTTAGRVIDEMEVRLVDPTTGEAVEGRRGQPACRGPATCEGYYNDPAANAQLYTPDGWMRMGDVVEIDSDGYLSVIGRTSDFIIRGGKNISAPAVEAEVMTHPRVALAAVVAIPDDVFGERVCAYVELRGEQPFALSELTDHLSQRGVTREWFPERLIIMSELPRSSGGKVAKSDLRADVLARMAIERSVAGGAVGSPDHRG
jgi:acyl-CoA synthetase